MGRKILYCFEHIQSQFFLFRECVFAQKWNCHSDYRYSVASDCSVYGRAVFTTFPPTSHLSRCFLEVVGDSVREQSRQAKPLLRKYRCEHVIDEIFMICTAVLSNCEISLALVGALSTLSFFGFIMEKRCLISTLTRSLGPSLPAPFSLHLHSRRRGRLRKTSRMMSS